MRRGAFRLSRLVGTLVLVGLAVALPQAGAITNGSYDNGNHPNVGVMFPRDRSVFEVGFCSGSLIAPREFLTAGHCTAALTALGRTPDQIYVSFDEQLSLSPEGVLSAPNPIAVTGWTTHPDYKFPHNDVGVIHLATAVGVTPVDLPEVGFLDAQAAGNQLRDHVFVNVGYGLNSLDRSFNSPQASVTWEHRRMVSSTPFQALTPDWLDQFGGTCFGDSGGPHFYGGAYPSLAIAVTSTGDATCGLHDSSQRLDTQSVHDFLAQYLH